MEGPGRDASCALPDGRTLEFWEGGDPDGHGVLFHGGTPTTNVFGRLGHDAAVSCGVRLVAINRPGYGGSSLPPGAPSLLDSGHDTAELARQLGMTEYAVLGTSGGGPFAVATAVADPDRVRAVGVVAGIGPWRELNEPYVDDPDGVKEERALLARLDAGEVTVAWDGFLASATKELSGLAGLDDDARVDTFFAAMPTPPTDPIRRSLWAASLADVVARPDGYVFDNLAWGATWDVDLADVVAPTSLWYGDADFMSPPANGHWYADHIAGSRLTVFPGENHIQVCSDHWAEELEALTA